MRTIPRPKAEPEPPKGSEYGKLKSCTLVNTPLKAATLLRKLENYEGWWGFDTEVAGPQLRGRDFVNITHSVLLGISLATEDGKTWYIPIRHKKNNISFEDLHKICTKLQERCYWLWAHNAKFDHQAMAIAGYPLSYLNCSMIAAWMATGKNWGLGLKDQALEVLGRKSPPFDPGIAHKTGDQAKVYACHDAINTLELGLHYFEPMTDEDRRWFLEECKFTHILAEMKLQGLTVDHAKLRGIEYQATKERNGIQKAWSVAAPDVSIGSAKSLQVLFEEGIWKPKGKTKGGAFETGKRAMEWNVTHAEGDGRELAQLRLDYQEVAKIVTTYSRGLIEESLQWADGKLHPDLFHFGTVTGRLASANPNIQNQPARGDWSARVRECFIPDPGMEFTAADYSQVELRYFADYCGGPLLDAFINNVDLHTITGDLLKHKIKDNKVRRDIGKRINFGFLLYGGGPQKLIDTVMEWSGASLTMAEAEAFIADLDRTYPEVERWRRHVIEVVSGRGTNPWAKTLAGRIRYFPELNPAYLKHSDPETFTALKKKYAEGCKTRDKKPTDVGLEWSIRGRGERLVVNYLIQGGARDLLVLGMNEYRRRAPALFSIVTTVHDEVLTQHPIGRGEEARSTLKECLEGAGPTLGLTVPIIAEPKTGATWAEVK